VALATVQLSGPNFDPAGLGAMARKLRDYDETV